MKIFDFIFKKFNKGLNKSLTIYNNNTRQLLRNTKKLEKKMSTELKEVLYDFLVYFESKKAFWTLKMFIVFFLAKLIIDKIAIFFRARHYKMLVGHNILEEMQKYETENVVMHRNDEKNANKIYYAYWMNYL
jgi:hypothetical protein